MIVARAGQLARALGKQAGEVDIAKWVNYFRRVRLSSSSVPNVSSFISSCALLVTTRCPTWRKSLLCCRFDPHFNNFHQFRFGGGSELLRDGDANNVWHILEHGFPCVRISSGRSQPATYCSRVLIIARQCARGRVRPSNDSEHPVIDQP